MPKQDIEYETHLVRIERQLIAGCRQNAGETGKETKKRSFLDFRRPPAIIE